MKPEGYMIKRGGIWHSRKQVRGERVPWSTKTGDKATAVRRAIDHWKQVVAENFGMVDRQSSRSTVATLDEVGEAYLAWPASKPTYATRRQNWNMLRRVVELGAGRWFGGRKVSAVLTSDLVEAFQAARLRAVEEADVECVERQKFSSNSMLTQARAVFRTNKPWKLAGLKVPEVREFKAAERFMNVQVNFEFQPFTALELAALADALPRLHTAHPRLWVAAVLMLYGGLRNSEVRRARRSWLRRLGEAGWISVSVSKSTKGVRWVPLPAWVADGVEKAAGEEWVIDLPTPTARANLVERELNDWVRRVVPGRQAYDFRRQAGSVVLDEQGIEAARDFLGHRSAETTRRWYASRIRALKPIGELRAVNHPRLPSTASA